MVEGMGGVVAKGAPFILYCVVNPAMTGTVGNVKAALHVLAGEVITGAVGNITTFTVLLGPQRPDPKVPAGIPPQAAAKTYLA